MSSYDAWKLEGPPDGDPECADCGARVPEHSGEEIFGDWYCDDCAADMRDDEDDDAEDEE